VAEVRQVKKVLIPAFVLVLALFLLFAIRGNWDSWKSDAVVQTTNDAYVTADQIPLSTRITGTVHNVDVGDYQAVKAGQLILELEDSDYKAMTNEASAAIEAAKAQLVANQDAKLAADAAVDSARQSVGQAQAAAEATQAEIDAAQAQVTHAATEYRRQETLLEGKATTHQQYEQALEARDATQAALQARRADLMRAQAAIASSKAALAGAQQQRSQLNANDQALKAQIEAKTAALTVAKVNLSYAKIYAPADGQVEKFQVHPGQLLSAGMQVVGFVQNGPWVEANYQETQLARVQVGDVAEITIDAYPSKKFGAYVSEIAPASGAASALLPPDNATGNFTKVVQRVPVELCFDNSADAAMLRTGLSARVTIHSDQKHNVPQTQANIRSGN
jgi:membrane fusion protein, multidrug efflux system